MIPFKDRLLKKKIKKREEIKMILMKNKGILKDNNTPADDKIKESLIESSEEKTESPPKKRKKLNKKIISTGNNFEVSNIEEQTHLANEENEVDCEFQHSSDSLFEEESYKNKVPDRIISHEILSNFSFSSLEGKVSVETLKAIEEMGFTKMTEIQARTIPPLLEGKNLAGNAKTGSGKTLAFLIPAVELITKLQYKPRNGAGCIIISPTRELAMQTFGVLQELMKYHKNTYGLVIGGAHRETEARKLQNGMNIIVATPGRLVDHLQNTQYFVTKNLINLVIDEADRILEIGFEETMRHILNILPKQRQTVLFSATTRKTEDLIKIAFNGPPLYIGLNDNLEKATVEGLDQGYLVVPSEKRFLVLFKFLKKCHKKKKVMVFFSTCLTVVFYDMLLNYIDIPVMSIHGKQKQSKRTSTFFKFSNAEKGILLCTDVAARGLDIPAVDWIIQYDPPEDTKEYIHRVGRTARGEGGSGRAMLYLRPEELSFLTYLHEAKVPLNEYDYNWSKVSDIQLQLEKLVGGNYALRVAAKEGFTACVRSYYSHRLKDAFDFEKLNVDSLAKNFGLSYAPDVVFETSGDKRKGLKKKK